MPKPGHENDIHKNPYIAYSCLMQVGTRLVVSNGSHTDRDCWQASPTELRHAMPWPPCCTGWIFEHDHLSTPRIAAIVDTADECGYLGIVRANELLVRCLPIGAGQAWYVATYEHTVPGDYADDSFDCASGDDACAYIMGRGAFADLERPITAACGVATGATSYDIAVRG